MRAFHREASDRMQTYSVRKYLTVIASPSQFQVRILTQQG